MAFTTVVSGGQAGADRAALDWAIAHGIPHGGWCPEGRKAEDGPIADRYLLQELAGAGYRDRTRANVRDSDATLIVSTHAVLEGGSLFTAHYAEAIGRPHLHIHPAIDWQTALAAWWSRVRPSTLNVAGPRASKAPDVGPFVTAALDFILAIETSTGRPAA